MFNSSRKRVLDSHCAQCILPQLLIGRGKYGMYYLIRTGIFIIVLLLFMFPICAHFAYNRKKRRIQVVIAVCIAMSAAVFSMLFPIENLFYSFKSPEEAFMYIGQAEPENVLLGQYSCIVSGKHGNDYVPDGVFTRAEDGWKLGKINDLRLCFATMISKEFTVKVRQFRNTDDYYVEIIDYTGTDKVITDKNGTSFFKGYQDKDSCSYYAYVNRFDMDYYIIVNGVQIKMNK